MEITDTVTTDNEFNEASQERELQRSESEARDIIHDLDRLYTFPEERKSRWVWELLQNAKDVATADGVEISITLSNGELTFSHNGQAFKTKHLLALLYKTSTKSLNGEDGTTGKYGTGFVTTHILNKKLKISGVHENRLGLRRFELEIDRSAGTFDESKALAAMKLSLAKTFLDIDQISKSPTEEVTTSKHSFKYNLSKESYIYAERGVIELERNIAFTLLINPKIKSISITTPEKNIRYVAEPIPTSIEGLHFISSNAESGILYTSSDELIFGIPAKKTKNYFELLPIIDQAVLFKEFPLIGTENFNLPVLIQHKDFHPTEQRDGIRTKKISEDEEDPTAEINRRALTQFVEAYLLFAKKIIDAKLDNLHLLAKSGIPAFAENYSNVVWYQTYIQNPIREFVLQQELVATCSGNLIRIGQAKFPKEELFANEQFYDLLAGLFPDQTPSSKTISHWKTIITQQEDAWPDQISIDVEELVKSVPVYLDINKADAFAWLKRLYNYLDSTKSALGEENPIFLNEANAFCLRNEVAIHPMIDNEFKFVSKGLGRSLDDEFLNRKLSDVASVKEFDLQGFYNNLNKELISELQIEVATDEQIKAIFHICGMFRSDKAHRREKWYSIVKQLLPELLPDKKIILVEYEYFWRSAELWSMKYICYLLEKARKPSVLAEIYFEDHKEECFEWLNNFLSFVFALNEDNSEVLLKRQIIPTQADQFKAYDEYVFAEQESIYFDDTIKNIYRDYTGKGDPRRFLVDTRINTEGIRSKDIDELASEIDKIFMDPHIETKVKKGGSLNEMFLQLNNWFENTPKASEYLRTFSNIRSTLYVLALGEGFSKQIMEIQHSGKSIEDITALAKIKLSPKEMQLLETASAALGIDKLLAKAKEMIDSKIQLERWKEMGDAAELAFEEAISAIDFEYKIENPDVGKDYELILNAKGYSIEIKSVAEGKENVRMSILQGRTAVEQRNSYALCVITRPNDEKITKDYFINHSRFVTNIGHQIDDKIFKWDEGLLNLNASSDNINVRLDDKTESVYVKRDIWRSGIPFQDFISQINEYFSFNEVN